MTRPLSHAWLLKAGGAYAAGAMLLFVFFRNTDWSMLADGLRSAGWLLLASAILVRLVALVVASLRWQALLEPSAHVPLGGVVAATMMGMTASTVAPVQAAELVRPYVLSSQQGVDFSTTIATAMAEWCLDAFAILVLFVPAALWYEDGRAERPWLVLGPALVLCLAVAGLAVLRILPRRAIRLSGWIQARRTLSPRARARIATWSQSFMAGLRTLDRRRDLIGVAAYSMLLAALTAISAWLTVSAFDLRLPFAAGFLLLGLVTVGGMIPTPGAVGGFHAVCQLGLMVFFTIDRARTVLPVLALHGVLYVPGALLGTLYFLSWPRRLRRSCP